MTVQPSPAETPPGRLELDAARRIDRACGRFEAAWQAGTPGPIEDALEQEPFGPEARDQLLRELVGLELDYRRARGESPVPGDYLARFPGRETAVLEVFGNDSRYRESLTATFAARDVDPGDDLDPPGYQVLGELGRGGMGVVYRALDLKRGRIVALKTVQRIDPAVLYRFKREFRALADVTHPNLVALHELISDGRRWFLAMELVEGVDFLTYVRAMPRSLIAEGPPTGLDPDGLDRLRVALRQLMTGLMALHDSGRLHRDVKPSNVRVTPEGRVVLLDFGLVTESEESDAHSSTDRQIVGTAAYMAPEQAASLDVGPAADWYAVGVMLHQALTGRLPFAGRPLEVLIAKQRSEPPSPVSLVPTIPADLDALCADLLRLDPSARPTGLDVLARLGVAPTEETRLTAVRAESSRLTSTPLIGRESHLRTLREVYREALEGRTTLVFIRGTSGSGKTTLVRAFLDEIARADPRSVIFHGRCYEQDSSPFKALDSVIEALSRFLKRLPPAEAEAFLPRDIGPLTRMFPVLGRVPVVASAPRRGAEETSAPQELRRRAFAALRDLLGRIGDRRPLLIALDDLQWGDLDSALLVNDLLKPPNPPNLLLIGSYRSEDAESSPLVAAVRGSTWNESSIPRQIELAIEPLDRAEAQALALSLMESRADERERLASTIARESGGNPLFVAELVRYLHTSAEGSEPGDPTTFVGELSLNRVIEARIGLLPATALALLEAVAAAGQPISPRSACLASGVSELDAGTDEAQSWGVLRSARLIRGIGSSTGEERVEVFHDRVREVGLTRMSPARRARLHRNLAEVLERTGTADAEVLAHHLSEGGESARASVAYARAGDQARSNLAFDHAAILYARALAQGPPDPRTQASLRVRRAESLAQAGRVAEAAEMFLEAIPWVGDDPREVTALRRQAALYFLISGHIERGLDSLRLALGSVGIRMPGSAQNALRPIAWLRLRACLRGTAFRERSEAEVPPEVLERIDLCWSAFAGLTVIDPYLGWYFQERGLLLALNAGEPRRIARALASEAGYAAVRGPKGQGRAVRLLRRAWTLAHHLDDARTRASVLLMAGAVANFQGKWRASARLFERSERLYQSHGPDVAWQFGAARIFAVVSLEALGRLDVLAGTVPAMVRTAQERGDVATILRLATHPLLRLAEDEPDRAEAELDAALARWGPDVDSVQAHHVLMARIQIALYRGEAKTAWTLIHDRPGAFDPFLSRAVQYLRIQSRQLRARVGLALGTPEGLETAGADARWLDQTGVPWAVAHSRIIEAGLKPRVTPFYDRTRKQDKRLPPDLVGIVIFLSEAERAFNECGMALFANAARWTLGQYLDKERGTSFVNESETWMRRMGIRSVERMTAFLAPGFDAGSLRYGRGED